MRSIGKISALAAVLMGLSLVAIAGGDAILKHYTLEQLDSAATLLLAASDEGAAGNPCHFPSAEAKTLLSALHPLIDAKIDQTISDARKSKDPITKAAWKTECQTECHCGLYGSILDKAGEDSDGYFELSQGEKTANCVKKTRWFCGSSLERYLRHEAPRFSASSN